MCKCELRRGSWWRSPSTTPAFKGFFVFYFLMLLNLPVSVLLSDVPEVFGAWSVGLGGDLAGAWSVGTWWTRGN